MKGKLIKLILLALAIYYVPRFCYEKTEGFAFTKIHSNIPYSPKWDVACGELPRVFEQRFTYLAAGGQAYAFASEDGQYVLKVFKHHLRRIPLWLRFLPLPRSLDEKREIQKQKRGGKLHRDFTSYKLAYEQLPEETGLLFVHLNKTNHLHQKARLVDKIGIEHSLDLDRVDFALQKRAQLAMPYLKKLIKKGEIEKAARAIDSICDLIVHRCQKGIYDEDPRIHRNVGFVDDKAILIDVGRLKIDPARVDPKIQQHDLAKITYRLGEYLKGVSPTLHQHLEAKISE